MSKLKPVEHYQPPLNAGQLSALALTGKDPDARYLALDKLCAPADPLTPATYRTGDYKLLIERARRLEQLLEAELQLLPEPVEIDASYCWDEELIGALLSEDTLVEFESFSPYADRHQKEGRVVYDPLKLSQAERTGLKIGGMLRRVTGHLGNTRPVILADEFTGLDPKLAGSWATRVEFLPSIIQQAIQVGLLLSEDLPGKDFVLLSESKLSSDIEKLVHQLGEGGAGQINQNGQQISFTPSEELLQKSQIQSKNRRSEMRKKGILLQTADGYPTCQAMDASGFMGEQNRHIVHLLILSEFLKPEQDKTYVLLNAMKTGPVRQDRFQNIFYSESQESERVVAAVAALMLQTTQRLKRRWSSYTTRQGVADRAEDNQQKAIPEEDRQIMQKLAEQLQQRFQPQSISRAADIGSGATPYPAMVAAPYLKTGIEIIEPDPNKLELMNRSIAERVGIWGEYKEYLTALNPELYQKALSETQTKLVLMESEVYKLPSNHYQLITSLFASESMWCDLQLHFRSLLEHLKKALSADGILIAAHRLNPQNRTVDNSGGRPLLALSPEELEQAYNDLDMKAEMEIIHNPDQASEINDAGRTDTALVVASPK